MTAVTPRPRSPVRPEIQALRALAVGLVMLYHFQPALAPAGFVGVDVFFVVSGFLITGILVRELDRDGRVRLRRFYLRRIRRILPAALIVLAVTALATGLFVPQRLWPSYFRQITASTLYYENWLLAFDSQGGGRRAELPSTPVQHFWSLSVEEQFYLLWPLVIILAVAIALRLRRNRRTTLAVVLGTVTIASFGVCLWLTAVDNNLGYFSTFARAWEFGLGGLLALTPAPAAGRAALRSIASIAGLAAIAASAFLLTDADAFPGAVALLPVAGTIAVIRAGMPASRLGPAAVLGWRPVQWMGDISYSLYLWHWPIIMLTPFITGVPSSTPVLAALLVLCFGLAWLTTRLVEDPIRSGRVRIAGPALAGAVVVMGLAIVGGATAATWAGEQQQLECRRP